MLAALGHEIYGNVSASLKVDVNNPPKPSVAKRKQDEIYAFTQGIAFLERFMKGEVYDQMSDPFKRGIIAALEREKEGLESWKQQ